MAKRTKYCKRCNKTLPRKMFSVNKANKDGLQFYCKTCQKELQEDRKVSEKRKLVKKLLAMLEPYRK